MWKQRRAHGESGGFRIKGTVGRIDHPPAGAFSKRYVLKNRPVVVRGALENRPATDWLHDEQEPTEVIVSKTGFFPDYESGEETMTKVQMSPAALIQRAEGKGGPPILAEGECYYIYGKPHLFSANPELGKAVPQPPCLAESKANGPFLWMSSPGSVTPAHYDLVNGVLVQISGRKKVWLFDRSQHDRLYQRGPAFPGMDNRERQSRVDIHHPDLTRFPLFAEAEAWETTLEPGDMLLIPSNWFHEVETLTTSISVGFNFGGGTATADFADTAEKIKSKGTDPLAEMMAQFGKGMDFAAIQKQLAANPQLMQQMMSHPMVQQMMQDPAQLAKMMEMMKGK